ncbi:MAG: gamma-glutamyltransferase family protein [Candidatus Tectomicrobia bacterium]|nr:gamma-glutamyltransferase family protein [Candidatus Tectomicrobia bacterium]
MQAQVVRGRRGAVSSGHHLASFEAARILRQGGNAVDAAVTAASVLAVVLPHACGLGSDAFLLIYEAASQRVHALNASGQSPQGADVARFARGIPRHGLAAATVPGMVSGWQAALRRFGTRSLREVLEPAIGYAAEGFPVHDKLAQIFADMAPALEQDAGAREVFLPQGKPPAAGEILRQPDLAASLRRLADKGSEAFYRGDLARRLVAHSREHGGLFTEEDLARHEPIWQEPLRASFCGSEVLTMPPNSYGLTLLLQLLALEAGGIAACDPDGAAFLRLGMAAREQAYRSGAPAIADPTVGEPAARELLAGLLKGVKVPPSGGRAGDGRAGGAAEGTDTSNVLVMDAQGNAVSLIQSVFHPFGCCVVPRATGVVLNNRMLGFRLEEGHPNRLAPGKRPAHTLTPVMVLRDGRPSMVCGTPGGPGQTATLAQFLTRLLAYGQPLGEAASAPRWSVAPGGGFVIEESVAPQVLAELQKADPTLKAAPAGGQPFGSLKAVQREGAGFIAVADFRRDAAAAAL